jgi:hypothetical protein
MRRETLPIRPGDDDGYVELINRLRDASIQCPASSTAWPRVPMIRTLSLSQVKLRALSSGAS